MEDIEAKYKRYEKENPKLAHKALRYWRKRAKMIRNMKTEKRFNVAKHMWEDMPLDTSA